jgi:hypothetical protein
MTAGDGYNDKGTYDYYYGAYTYFNTYYLREETVANLDDSNYAHLYQKTRNYDYMTFDRYDGFKPKDSAYRSQNENKKIESIFDVSDCGDCIRGGFVYCNKKSIFGTEYSNSQGKIESACCKTRALCMDKINSPDWKCSTSYSDDIYQYNICPNNVNKCDGGSWIELGRTQNGHSPSLTKRIRGLNKGETCSYRIKAWCGAPTF